LCVLFLCALPPGLACAGERAPTEALRRQILAMDVRLSDAYADCRSQGLRALFTDDAELIFAGRGRVRGVSAHQGTLRREGCGLRREADASAQQVYALPGHLGAIDGALQVGTQTFCARNTQPCRGVATRFVAVWHRTASDWRIARLIRYDYRDPP
jgi:hypothetical protein